MTPDQIELIQDSFPKVVPISDAATGIFYDRLFEITPEERECWIAAYATSSGGMIAAADDARYEGAIGPGRPARSKVILRRKICA